MFKVLLIDSDPLSESQLHQALAAEDMELYTTTDSQTAVECVKTYGPHAIVLCVELSGFSGYSICNKLKKDPRFQHIPLVLTSSLATPETFEQHQKLKTHAQAYLKKPYEVSDLVFILTSLLSSGPSEPQATSPAANPGPTRLGQEPSSAEEAAGSLALRQGEEPLPHGMPHGMPDGMPNGMYEEIQHLRRQVQNLEQRLQAQGPPAWAPQITQTGSQLACQLQQHQQMLEQAQLQLSHVQDLAEASFRHHQELLRQEQTRGRQLQTQLVFLNQRVQSWVDHHQALRQRLGSLEHLHRQDLQEHALHTQAQDRAQEEIQQTLDATLNLLEKSDA